MPALGQHNGSVLDAPSADSSVAASSVALPQDAAAPVQIAQPGPEVEANDDKELIERARQLFWSAYHEYNDGRYDQAVDLFEESYRIYPQTEVLFNMALAHAENGSCEVARARAAEYAAQSAPSANDAHVATLRERMGRTCGFDAAATVADGAAAQHTTVGTAPKPEPAVPAATFVAERSVVDGPMLTPVVAPSPIADQETQESYWTPRRQLAWGLLGGAAVAGGFTVYFARELARLDEANDELMDDIRNQEESSDAGDQLYQNQSEHRRDSWLVSASAALTVGFSVAGIVLLNSTPSITAQVKAAGKDTAQLSLSARF